MDIIFTLFPSFPFRRAENTVAVGSNEFKFLSALNSAASNLRFRSRSGVSRSEELSKEGERLLLDRFHKRLSGLHIE